MIAFLKAFLTSLSLELAAFGSLLLSPDPWIRMPIFCALHLIASIVVAFAVWPFMPPDYRQPRKQTLLFLVAFGFFTPGLAFIGLFLFAFSARYLGVRVIRYPFAGLQLPGYFGGAAAPPPNYGPGGIRARLFGKGVATEARVKTMLLAQAIPPQMTSALWRSLLSDSIDDIRLVAYQTLDAREKRLNRAILDMEKELENTTVPAVRTLLTKQLAASNWEMLYMGLAQGAVAGFIRDKVKALTLSGLEADPEDPDLWLLLGRLALTGNDAIEAERAFLRSLQLGMPRTRVVPYLAELAYNARNHERARELFDSAPAHDYALSLAPVVKMWHGGRA